MKRSDNILALTDVVAQFQEEVRQLAVTAAHAILKQELERKRAKAPRPRGRPGRSSAPGGATRERAAPVAAPPPAPSADAAPAALTDASAPAEQPSAAMPSNGKKRVPWTREAVIHELASWMASGTSIDAAFVTRHGPPGLVAATRRIFGRFEAALNVAGLHVAKLYPEGPPAR
jgi:hypothetical protein